MACAHPFLMRPVSKVWKGAVRYQSQYVPCGWCLNCRKDRQNYFIDRAEYEYKTRLTGAFVTFTYDQLHLLDECLVKDGFGHPIVEKDGRYRATLRFDHLEHFIDSIRKYVLRHTEIQGVLCQPDFSYMYVGEYGDVFGRPHYHVLFFGLDFAFCEKIIFSRWTRGFIDVLPILEGGIKYVTKYMDKQSHGALAKEQFDFKGLARPKLRCSRGFGKGLLLDNLKDIVEHDYTYACGKGLRRPISQYWKMLLTGKELKRDVSKTRRYAVMQLNRINEYRREVNLPSIDFDKAREDSIFRAQKEASEFSIKRARLREYNLTLMARADGLSCVNPDEIMFSKFGHPKYCHDELQASSDDIKHWLATDYLERLVYGDDVPF